MPRVKRGNVIDLTGEDSEEAGPSSRPTQAAAVEASGVGPPEGKRKGKKRRISAATEAVDDERGKKQGKKGKPEKRVDAAGRTVRYASAPSIKSQGRISRAMPGSGHRLFLIDRKLLSPVGSEEGAAEEFAVLGATGNVYTVTICRQPQCTCPDYLKGNLCKHILFVMLRVLRLPTDEPLVWQRALLTDEVNAVLSGEKSEGPAEVQRGVLAADAVRAQYRRLSSQGGSGSGEEHASGNQRPVEGDCPICFESLSAQGMGDNKVTFCAGSCGNNVHVGCMRMWLGSTTPPAHSVGRRGLMGLTLERALRGSPRSTQTWRSTAERISVPIPQWRRCMGTGLCGSMRTKGTLAAGKLPTCGGPCRAATDKVMAGYIP